MIKKEVKAQLIGQMIKLLKHPTGKSLEKSALTLAEFIRETVGDGASKTSQEYEQFLHGKHIRNKREIVDVFKTLEEIKYADRQITKEETTKIINFILELIINYEVQPDEPSKTFLQKVFKH
ncbi:MAG TPA: hypothetical protein VJJ82_02420 [Candidatus Nanoarchaeia archaeon]|nr:hypothetical protein [Candidatus Nanoarchaeia archaeon]